MYEECFESGECETVTKPNSAEEPEEVRQGLAKRWNLQKGLELVNRYQYSLHPDNINGWKSKHALYSVPLLYGSNNIDQVLRSVLNDDRYKLAYLGRRHSSSVQVNKCNHYPWKYRESELKTLVAEELRKAVDSRVGKPEQCEYTFDSNFESGNLDAAIRIKPNEYDCFLRCDTNTRGHTNWYYFKVSNHEHIGELSLTICNIGKARNLYSRGMKPYSRCHSEWTQESCYDVLFGERYLRYGEDKKSYHLQFKYNFKQPNQTVEFAYAIPYTYSDLCTFIDRLKDQNGTLVNSRKLCDSLGSLSVPLLTITSPSCPQDKDENNRPVHPHKKAILVTGRIHPGESNASHVLQGIVRGLLADTPEAKLLRETFVVYVVPMINPDGVVAGNFRTGFAGKDLNRQFNRLNKNVFPEITYLAELAAQLKSSHRKGFRFYFDIHGHSAKKGLFCYGPEHNPGRMEYFKSRLLAKTIEGRCKVFSYRSSIFTINEHKKSTGRAHMLWTVKVPMSYTFQISNGLYDHDGKCVLLNRKILLQAGAEVVTGLGKYVEIEMRIPRVQVKAKVDTNRYPLRPISNKIRSNSSTGIGRAEHVVPGQAKHDISHTSLVDTGNEQLLRLLKEIKEEAHPVELIEGGSDSEEESQDLGAEQQDNLMRMIENRSNTAATGKSKKEASNYRIRKSKLELKKKHESCDMEQEKADEVEEMDSKERAETLESKKPLLNMLNIPRKLTCQPPPRFKRKMFLEEKNMQKEVHIVTIAI